MIERKLQKYAVNTHPATFGAPEPKDSPVMTSSVSSIPAGTDHGSLSGLLDDDHIQYLRTNGVRQLLADWDAGSWKITAKQLESDIATGTAPLIVVSTTKVTNLNADLLDSQSGAYYLDSANFTGTNWTDLTDAGATTLHKHDHGLMDGLGDDDHTQYIFNAPTTDTRNVIQPSTATVKGLILKGAASQSDNLLEFQDSAGNIKLRINPSGGISNSSALSTLPLRLSYGTPTVLPANQVNQEVVAAASQSATAGLRGSFFVAEITNTVSQSGAVLGLNAFAYHTGSAGLTHSGAGLAGGRYTARAFSDSGAAPVIAKAVGISAYVEDSDGTSSTGSITNAVGVQAEGNKAYGGAFTLTNSFNFYGIAHQDLGGTITNAYGLYLEKQTAGGTLNNEIFLAGAGEIFFRDQAIHLGSLTDGHLDLTADVSIDLNGAVVGTSTALFTRLIVDDTGTYIDKDGSNNMIFVDAVTGSKTLAELAAGGDVGEGHITIFPFNYSSVFQGTWSFLSLASQWGAYVFRNSSTAINDALDFQVYLEAGTYSLSVLYVKFSTYGIMEFYNVTDASSIGTIDGYAAGVTYNQLTTLTGYVVSSAGLKTIRMRSTTKNASSSAYQMSISSFAFFRTA